MYEYYKTFLFVPRSQNTFGGNSQKLYILLFTQNVLNTKLLKINPNIFTLVSSTVIL